MNLTWIRDYIYRVIKPFLAQLKNRISNIRLIENPDGSIKFYNGENVATNLNRPAIATIKKNEATNLVSFFRDSSADRKTYGCAFTLSIAGTYGNYVISDIITVNTTSNVKGHIEIISGDTTYGSYWLRLYIDNLGNGTVSIVPNTGSDNLEGTLQVKVSNFVGGSFEYTPSTITGTYKYGKNSAEGGFALQPTNTRGIYIDTPDDARLGLGGIPKGRLVIKYPFNGATFTMGMFELISYQYSTGRSFKMIFGGYNYSSPKWYNPTAKRLTQDMHDDYTRVQFVRFLKAGGDETKNEDYTHFGFIIGKEDDTSLWSYPKFAISKMMLGHQGATRWRFKKGWFMQLQKADDIEPHKVDFTITV